MPRWAQREKTLETRPQIISYTYSNDLGPRGRDAAIFATLFYFIVRAYRFHSAEMAHAIVDLTHRRLEN